jgi:hypothetical protein
MKSFPKKFPQCSRKDVNKVVRRAIEEIIKEDSIGLESLRPTAPKNSLLLDSSEENQRRHGNYSFEKFIFDRVSREKRKINKRATLRGLAAGILQSEILCQLEQLKTLSSEGRPRAMQSIAAVALMASEILAEYVAAAPEKLRAFAANQYRWPVLISPHSEFSFQRSFIKEKDPFSKALNDLTDKLELGRSNLRIKCSRRYRNDELMRSILAICDRIESLRLLGPARISLLHSFAHYPTSSLAARAQWELKASRLPAFNDKPRTHERWSGAIKTYFDLHPELLLGLNAPPTKRTKSGVGFGSAIRQKVDEKIRSLFQLNKAK